MTRYCTKLKGLDLGHNAITDISFIENMPHLRVLILADNDLTDISPL
ncbi:MAG: leucine-rich repeat domain-containing protein, partial [Prevotella sp.]|nr:leucine-rich repeat domain-containing protein [Prevotella sp.]